MDRLIGFNAAVDLSRALTSEVPVAGIIRHSLADVPFDDSQIWKHTLNADGVETLGGVRFRL